MANMKHPTDEEWLLENGYDVDIYDFSERVGIILDDDALNPPLKKLLAARNQAIKELLK